MIGVNPATDNVATVEALLRMLDRIRERYRIPTQICVLAHVTTQMEALRRGAPVDLVFQSIAGTEAANASFGVNLAMLDEACQAARELGRGEHVMYFETGQGSALSANAHHGVDQQTCEARAYAVARRYRPLLVNTVVGFIGPEYLYDGKQILRAGLEDHFCGKLLGLPMGCDICYTNHAEADQDDMDALLTLLGVAGVQLHHGRARRRRRDAALPEHQFSRRAVSAPQCSACGRRPNSKPGSSAASGASSCAMAIDLRSFTPARVGLGPHRPQPADGGTAALPAGPRPRARCGLSGARSGLARRTARCCCTAPRAIARRTCGGPIWGACCSEIRARNSAAGDYDAAIVIADGLSATAVHHTPCRLLEALLPRLDGLASGAA